MFKNVASQKLTVLVIDTTSNVPKTGDAANLTCYVSKDDGAVTVLGDTSATELDATNAPGLYSFDLTQAETNADKLLFSGKSSTSGVKVVPLLVYTRPANFTSQSIDSNGRVDVIKIAGTTQTARDIGASVLLSAGTGTGQLDFTSGVVKANAVQLLGTAWLTPGTAGTPDVNVKLAGGTAWNSGAIGASTLATDTITAAKIAADAIGASELASDAVAEILTALWAKVVGYGSTTFEKHLIIMGAASAGKTSGVGVGAPVFRDLDDTKDVISGSLDGSKNRTSSTLTP